jgi:4-hydroxybenzoate polyprenyltransferase
LIVGLLQLVMLLLLVIVGVAAGLGPAYYIGLAVAAGLSGYQQWLIRDRKPSRCFEAFLNNNYFGMAVFVGLVIDYLLEPATRAV